MMEVSVVWVLYYIQPAFKTHKLLKRLLIGRTKGHIWGYGPFYLWKGHHLFGKCSWMLKCKYLSSQETKLPPSGRESLRALQWWWWRSYTLSFVFWGWIQAITMEQNQVWWKSWSWSPEKRVWNIGASQILKHRSLHMEQAFIMHSYSKVL